MSDSGKRHLGNPPAGFSPVGFSLVGLSLAGLSIVGRQLPGGRLLASSMVSASDISPPGYCTIPFVSRMNAVSRFTSSSLSKVRGKPAEISLWATKL